MTPARGVSVGQRVKVKHGGSIEFVVVAIFGNGALIRYLDPESDRRVLFAVCEDLILPEPPKAEPGVVYRSNGIIYIGLANGRIGRTVENGIPSNLYTLSFDPTQFAKVEPQP